MLKHGIRVLAQCAMLICPLAVLAADPTPAPAPAPENEVGVLAGVGYADKNLTGEDRKLGPAVGLRFAHFFGAEQKWSWFADATYSRFDVVPLDEKLDAWTLRTGPEFFLSPIANRARWFVAPSVGWERFAIPGDSATRGLASLGLGQRIAVGEKNHFSWQVRADQSLGSSGLDGEKVLNFQALVGYAWGICSGADADGDGVANCRDACPSTPKGATVDAKGCPMDADLDGVWDGIDKCPATPRGATVDATGCPADSDGDGVWDGIDRCPNTPKGATVDATGCPKDSDGDGVYDGLDKCPGTPRGVAVDATGCPMDSDHDGVLDDADKCPDTPAGTKVDATGCPIVEKAAPIFAGDKKTLVLEGVYFDTDKATLKPESSVVLDRVAKSLVDWPDVRVQVDGHTDSVGGAAHNQKLSQARAEAVKNYLASKGVDASRLTTKGFGKTKPIADNKTEDGRAKNRRVELTKVD